MKLSDNIFNYLPQNENNENIEMEEIIEINIIDFTGLCDVCEQNRYIYHDDEEECVSGCEKKITKKTYTFLPNESLEHFLFMLELNDDYPLSEYERKKLFMILKKTTLSEYLSEGQVDYTKEFSMTYQQAFNKIKENEEFMSEMFPNSPVKRVSVEDFIKKEKRKYNENKENTKLYYEQIMKGFDLKDLIPTNCEAIPTNKPKKSYDINIYYNKTYISKGIPEYLP